MQSSLAMKNNYAVQKISYAGKRQSLLDDLEQLCRAEEIKCREGTIFFSQHQVLGGHGLFETIKIIMGCRRCQISEEQILFNAED